MHGSGRFARHTRNKPRKRVRSRARTGVHDHLLRKNGRGSIAWKVKTRGSIMKWVNCGIQSIAPTAAGNALHTVRISLVRKKRRGSNCGEKKRADLGAGISRLTEDKSRRRDQNDPLHIALALKISPGLACLTAL